MIGCSKDLIQLLNVAHIHKHFKAAFGKYATQNRMGVSVYCKHLVEAKTKRVNEQVTILR